VGFAADGVEAIRLYKEAKDTGNPYSAVVLDLTVRGGMGGKEAIEKLLRIDPNVRGVVSSGYSDDPVMTDFGVYGFRGVVSKPYTVLELSETLNGVIGERESI
jgi:CheY-like chemotaxis protein